MLDRPEYPGNQMAAGTGDMQETQREFILRIVYQTGVAYQKNASGVRPGFKRRSGNPLALCDLAVWGDGIGPAGIIDKISGRVVESSIGICQYA